MEKIDLVSDLLWVYLKKRRIWKFLIF